MKISISKTQSIIRRILFATLTSLVTLMIIECILRVETVSELAEKLIGTNPNAGFSPFFRLFGLEPSGNGKNIYRVRSEFRRTFRDTSFDEIRESTSVRIFCLGGSSTFGYPWDEKLSFPAFLQRALSYLFPGRKIEVVNMGAMSYGSMRIKLMMPELLGHKPDLLVIYSGHNEFVEEEIYKQVLKGGDIRQFIAATMARSRLYYLLQTAASGFRPDLKSLKTPDGGNEMAEPGFVERAERKLFTMEEKSKIVSAFEKNLREITRDVLSGGISVTVSTLPSNLRDWNPEHLGTSYKIPQGKMKEFVNRFAIGKRLFASGDFDLALLELEMASELEPRHAGLRYMIASAKDRLGRSDEAKNDYALARDLDPVPIRATKEINDAIKRVTFEEGAWLVDSEKGFEKASEVGIIGSDLIIDYCHPTPKGNALIARMIMGKLADAGFITSKEEWNLKSLDESGVLEAPEEGDENLSYQTLWWLGVVERRRGHLNEAEEKFGKAIDINPLFTPAKMELANIFLIEERLDDALRMLERILDSEPSNVDVKLRIAAIHSQMGEKDKALHELESLADANPENPYVLFSLGNQLMIMDRTEDALSRYEKAAHLLPDFFQAIEQAGIASMKLGDNEKAAKKFRTVLEIVNYSPVAAENLRRLGVEP